MTDPAVRALSAQVHELHERIAMLENAPTDRGPDRREIARDAMLIRLWDWARREGARFQVSTTQIQLIDELRRYTATNVIHDDRS